MSSETRTAIPQVHCTILPKKPGRHPDGHPTEIALFRSKGDIFALEMLGSVFGVSVSGFRVAKVMES